MELDRIRLKEAIVMWPDMHSFFGIRQIRINLKFLISLRKIDHVLRFSD